MASNGRVARSGAAPWRREGASTRLKCRVCDVVAGTAALPTTTCTRCHGAKAHRSRVQLPGPLLPLSLALVLVFVEQRAHLGPEEALRGGHQRRITARAPGTVTPAPGVGHVGLCPPQLLRLRRRQLASHLVQCAGRRMACSADGDHTATASVPAALRAPGSVELAPRWRRRWGGTHRRRRQVARPNQLSRLDVADPQLAVVVHKRRGDARG